MITKASTDRISDHHLPSNHVFVIFTISIKLPPLHTITRKKKQFGIHWSDHQIPKQQTWRDSLCPCLGIHDSQPNISILKGLNIFHDINLDQWGGGVGLVVSDHLPRWLPLIHSPTLCDRPYLIVQGGVHYALCSYHWCTSITYALSDQTATFLQINNSANQNEAVGCKSWSPVAQCAHSMKGCEESPWNLKYCSTRNKSFLKLKVCNCISM